MSADVGTLGKLLAEYRFVRQCRHPLPSTSLFSKAFPKSPEVLVLRFLGGESLIDMLLICLIINLGGVVCTTQ